ncbi:quaternary amine ABC transporter ATP-binding protein [Thermoflavimicrobium daqui]|uniref:Quaternary amine transport ATP-binding protein n=1 Tax=Thermoflavimicrobium daqui TaxID=2137476 RepID=A0A364K7Z8_9BACL|nr:glycine betaine/L-proline ABC transporter ATP-binding protein [Thermoflavimicrobium daqui]RAL26425.1 glycine betaine/L-proline ABC transporter ATP-binding protein [Thermoflavimicrobium daqui]
MYKIEVKNVTKIFGHSTKKALQLLHEGKSKEEIKKKTGANVGVNRANFYVNSGEIFVIMGLSGSGKSTLVRLLNRLIQPTEGEVFIDGEDIIKMSSEQLRNVRRKKISMVFQKFALFPHRTVRENVEYGLEIQGVSPQARKEKALESLKLVGLEGWAESFPDQLSGGMQQRVGLARALANDPDILLMDEAFSALDPLIRKDMQDELIDLQQTMQKTIIFITHDLDEALRIGDRIALMKDGSIVQIGTTEEILTNPANEYVEQFVEDVNLSKVLTAETIMTKGEAIILDKDGLKVARKKMREKRVPTLLVIDRRKKFRGLVTVHTIREALEQNKSIEEVLVTDVPQVRKETPINEILPLIAEIDPLYPIVVTDEDGKLLGLVGRGAILAALAGSGVSGE